MTSSLIAPSAINADRPNAVCFTATALPYSALLSSASPGDAGLAHAGASAVVLFVAQTRSNTVGAGLNKPRFFTEPNHATH